MREFWYRAFFDIEGGNDAVDDYKCVLADTIEQADKEAIEWARERAAEGEDFIDTGHKNLELFEVSEVDPNKEWDSIRTIYH